jgi:hypothetical protein
MIIINIINTIKYYYIVIIDILLLLYDSNYYYYIDVDPITVPGQCPRPSETF